MRAADFVNLLDKVNDKYILEAAEYKSNKKAALDNKMESYRRLFPNCCSYWRNNTIFEQSIHFAFYNKCLCL